VVGDSGKPSVW